MSATHCGACGQALGEGPHDGCARLLSLDPPRFCAVCGFRLDVQVLPAEVRSHCRECRRRARNAARAVDTAGAGGHPADSDLLAEQIAYYRDRAPEYDRLFDEALADDRVARSYAQIVRFIQRLDRRGDVLELACGTGQWTPLLLAHGTTRVTAVDAAPEALAIHSQRVRDRRVERVCADVFAWRPPRRYPLVFFGFWLSHVPRGRFADFWTRVAQALTPGGQAAFIDSDPSGHSNERWVTPGVARRTLETGSTYHVVKVFYEPAELVDRLAEMGWDAHAELLDGVFLAGTARRR